jgi:hypothetical protein
MPGIGVTGTVIVVVVGPDAGDDVALAALGDGADAPWVEVCVSPADDGEPLGGAEATRRVVAGPLAELDVHAGTTIAANASVARVRIGRGRLCSPAGRPPSRRAFVVRLVTGTVGHPMRAAAIPAGTVMTSSAAGSGRARVLMPASGGPKVTSRSVAWQTAR